MTTPQYIDSLRGGVHEIRAQGLLTLFPAFWRGVNANEARP